MYVYMYHWQTYLIECVCVCVCVCVYVLMQVEAGKAELEKLQRANQSRQSEIKEVSHSDPSNTLYMSVQPPVTH